MTKLLSDIDISRSVAVASFLELESAARSCMSLSCTKCCYASNLVLDMLTFVIWDPYCI